MLEGRAAEFDGSKGWNGANGAASREVLRWSRGLKSYETVSHRFTRGPVLATAATAKLTGTTREVQDVARPGFRGRSNLSAQAIIWPWETVEL